MNWKNHIALELRGFYDKAKAQPHILERIQDLDQRIKTPRITQYTDSPKSHNTAQDYHIGLIVEKEELETLYKNNNKDLQRIQQAVDQLKDREKEVLTQHYFNNTSYETIAEKMDIDPSTVYRIKKTAITNLTLYLYGKE